MTTNTSPPAETGHSGTHVNVHVEVPGRSQPYRAYRGVIDETRTTKTFLVLHRLDTDYPQLVEIAVNRIFLIEHLNPQPTGGT